MSGRLEAWESELSAILAATDKHLESLYGSDFPLHPARLPSSTAANPQYDGLFRITALFTAGFGSEYGAGYVLRVELVTLSTVPPQRRAQYEAEAVSYISTHLPSTLRIVRDGAVWKIIGDLSLGATTPVNSRGIHRD